MGTMVTRYRIEDSRGRFLTAEGYWTPDIDDAMQFSLEEAAQEEAANWPRASVEEFRRYSDFADLIVRGARLDNHDHRAAVDLFNRRAGR